MISFKLTDEQEVVRDALHDFAEQAVRPIARDADEIGHGAQAARDLDVLKTLPFRVIDAKILDTLCRVAGQERAAPVHPLCAMPNRGQDPVDR